MIWLNEYSIARNILREINHSVTFPCVSSLHRLLLLCLTRPCLHITQAGCLHWGGVSEIKWGLPFETERRGSLREFANTLLPCVFEVPAQIISTRLLMFFSEAVPSLLKTLWNWPIRWEALRRSLSGPKMHKDGTRIYFALVRERMQLIRLSRQWLLFHNNWFKNLIHISLNKVYETQCLYTGTTGRNLYIELENWKLVEFFICWNKGGCGATTVMNFNPWW